jgi:hypothetical protein
MPDAKSRAARREQQAREVEESQTALRKSIAETQLLVDKSEEMLERHRREREVDDLAGDKVKF